MSEESKDYKKKVIEMASTSFGNELLSHIQECEDCKKILHPVVGKIMTHIEELDRLK